MIANSREWARQKGLLQRNEVHGKEEWKIPTNRSFSFNNEVSQQTEQRGTMAVEDGMVCPRFHLAMVLLFNVHHITPHGSNLVKDKDGSLLENDITEDMAFKPLCSNSHVIYCGLRDKGLPLTFVLQGWELRVQRKSAMLQQGPLQVLGMPSRMPSLCCSKTKMCSAAMVASNLKLITYMVGCHWICSGIYQPH